MINSVCRLSNICNEIEQHSDDWKKAYLSIDDREVEFPEPYRSGDKLTQLLIVKCLRPDRLIYFVENIFTELISDVWSQRVEIDFDAAFSNSGSGMPFIVFASADAEIMTGLNEFVAKMRSDR